MCVARLCTDVYALDTAVETDTQQGYRQRAEKQANKLGILLYSNRAHVTVA